MLLEYLATVVRRAGMRVKQLTRGDVARVAKVHVCVDFGHTEGILMSMLGIHEHLVAGMVGYHAGIVVLEDIEMLQKLVSIDLSSILL